MNTDYIFKLVTSVFEVTKEQILSDSKERILYFARVACAHQLLDNGYTLNMVGRLLNRDHSTIAYYKSMFPVLMKQDKLFYNKMKSLTND